MYTASLRFAGFLVSYCRRSNYKPSQFLRLINVLGLTASDFIRLETETVYRYSSFKFDGSHPARSVINSDAIWEGFPETTEAKLETEKEESFLHVQ